MFKFPLSIFELDTWSRISFEADLTPKKNRELIFRDVWLFVANSENFWRKMYKILNNKKQI